MITVELRNQHNKAVATIEVPEMPSRPGIVKWGSMYYQLRARPDEGSQTRVYDEAGWCYAVPLGGTVST